MTYEADTTFWVSHGWVWEDWSEATPQERQAFMHPSQTFLLYIDGDLQRSSMWARYVAFGVDVQVKLFTTEIHGGLPAGTYTFTGEWYFSEYFDGGDFRNSVLFDGPCELTVNLT